LAKGLTRTWIQFVYGNEGRSVGPGSDPALLALLKALGQNVEKLRESSLRDSAAPIHDERANFDPAQRQRRHVEQLVEHTQRLMRESEAVRNDFLWSKAK